MKKKRAKKKGVKKDDFRSLYSILARRQWELTEGTAIYQELENQELLNNLDNPIFWTGNSK